MRVEQLLSPERIGCHISASSKKRTLEQLSELLQNGADVEDKCEIFDALLERERLGTTGFGKGVAIPHGRLKSIKEPIAAFVTLEPGIDFDAVDHSPVDLILALLVPDDSADTHIELLSQIAEMLRDSDLTSALRNAANSEAIIAQLSHWKSH
ncbi:MAG: PTS sugar transporter subunit IIA [Gammaproteobacteria bacterium]|nr:PTS sugar transporter subunit IIA [Gammaproteobacteria bacterium]